MKTVVGLPVDGRPVVRAQVQQLVALTQGFELRCPAIDELGDFRIPADRDHLAQWLRDQVDDAAGWVLSLDMLVYGGLIPSRFIDDAEASLRERLTMLRELKRPGVPLTAFAATMRISSNCMADEEKPYWNPHGLDLWTWSFHTDRHALTGDAASQAAAAVAAARVPDAIRADYRATRARNFAINLAALELVEQDVIDRLVLPQDDTAEYGFNIAERRALQAEAARRRLLDRVLIYPGADEVMHTLSAWVVGRLRGDPPLRVNVLPTDAAHWQRLVPLYEDRPLPDALAAQLQAVGAVQAAEDDDAELLLLVHSQGSAQGDWAMRKPLTARVGVDAGIWPRLASAHAVAVADDAHANGGDPAFVAELAAHLPLHTLAGYAGWNTSSNRIGSLLAQLVLARGRWATPANQAVVALRLAEDLQWQARLRQTLRDRVDEAAMPATALAQQAQALMVEDANAWLATMGFPQRVKRAWLPWRRSFEIGLDVQ
ncbi:MULTISPECIES: DUF4127 family protein [unclassified Roseateles]|uniref:DUF4127 family protein n=1 Tax=unclassified Roseateles TaxID=2626991 RepID=UPI0006F753DB|nr:MULTISPECIES: DUF4127 family protein [unclassified Roseateles]KQW44867.1 hypothetical protein ASC81_14985 [Pelomonas sp. Root405]KRA70226.1 hypothetical protein ASD88_19145 [Pelomonas sp. Root662]